jgi:hypothetical protein
MYSYAGLAFRLLLLSSGWFVIDVEAAGLLAFKRRE